MSYQKLSARLWYRRKTGGCHVIIMNGSSGQQVDGLMDIPVEIWSVFVVDSSRVGENGEGEESYQCIKDGFEI